MENKFPKKTREIMNHHMDSTVWNEFEFREGDIVSFINLHNKN